MHITVWGACVQEDVQAIDWSTIEFSKNGARPLNRRRIWAVQVCWYLSFPMLVCCGFFAAIYGTMSGVTEESFLSSRAAWAIDDCLVSWGINVGECH